MGIRRRYCARTLSGPRFHTRFHPALFDAPSLAHSVPAPGPEIVAVRPTTAPGRDDESLSGAQVWQGRSGKR